MVPAIGTGFVCFLTEGIYFWGLDLDLFAEDIFCLYFSMIQANSLAQLGQLYSFSWFSWTFFSSE